MKLIRVSATNKIAQDTTIVCPTQAYFWHNDVVGLAHVTFHTCRYPNTGHMQAMQATSFARTVVHLMTVRSQNVSFCNPVTLKTKSRSQKVDHDIG